MKIKVLKKPLLILSCTFLCASCGGGGGDKPTPGPEPEPEPTSSYTITYNLDGGEVINKTNPTSYTSTSEDITLNKPYKTGYTFKGWSLSEGGETTVNYKITKGSKGNLTFFANYQTDPKALNGKEVNSLSNGANEYINCTDDNVADYLYRFGTSSQVRGEPKGVTLRWNNTYKTQYTNLLVASDSGFDDVVVDKIFDSTTSYTIYNLMPKTTYYVRVIDSNDDVIFNDTFKLAGNLRAINAGGIVNMRDIGGWATESGVNIPYGKVYRSSNVQNLNDEGKKIFKSLGIKTELDLIYYSSGAPSSPISTMNYVNAPLWHWAHCFPGASTDTPSDTFSIDGLTKSLKTFADSNAYPIDVHCSGGADRTGTVMFVLEGLLGFTYESMARDFELTTFSEKGNRYRAGFSLSGDKYVFDDSVDMKDGSGFSTSFNKIYHHVMDTYKTSSGKIADAMENYVKTVLKLTDSEINAIKTNILG